MHTKRDIEEKDMRAETKRNTEQVTERNVEKYNDIQPCA